MVVQRAFPEGTEEEWLRISHLFETCASTNFWDMSCFIAAGVGFGFFFSQSVSLHFPSSFCFFLMFSSFPICRMQVQWKLEFSFQNYYIQLSIKLAKRNVFFIPAPQCFCRGKNNVVTWEDGKTIRIWGNPAVQNRRIAEPGRDPWRSSATCLHKAGSTQAACLQLCPVGFWASPRMETP